jgi:hypothetical protein
VDVVEESVGKEEKCDRAKQRNVASFPRSSSNKNNGILMPYKNGRDKKVLNAGMPEIGGKEG